MYFGLSVGLQLLDVSFISLVLQSTSFMSCFVSASPGLGGNAYGGAVSVYAGAYYSVISSGVFSAAAVDDTLVRNVSVTLNSASFSFCSATRTSTSTSFGANVFGGAFSLYIGAYAWSTSNGGGGSSSNSGSTTAIGVSVTVSNTRSSNCSATSLNNASSGSGSYGANAFGGSMSLVYIGAYAWSYAFQAESSSLSGVTTARDISVSLTDVASSSCVAATTYFDGTASDNAVNGATSLGGSTSVLYVGAHVYSATDHTSVGYSSTSASRATTASSINLSITNASFTDCSAAISMTFPSNQTSIGSIVSNSFGGSLSILHLGAYAWSASDLSTSSASGATSATNVSVSVSNSKSVRSHAVVTTNAISGGNYEYGEARGAGSFGGSMSVVHVGAQVMSRSVGDSSSTFSAATCGPTSVTGLSLVIKNSTFTDSLASSRAYFALLISVVLLHSRSPVTQKQKEEILGAPM